MSQAADRIRAGLLEADEENAGTAWYAFVRREDIQTLLREQAPAPPQAHPSMTADQLAALQTQKDEVIAQNTKAVDENYLIHEDFIARFDKTISRIDESIKQRGYLHLAEWMIWNQTLTELRNFAHQLLLGPENAGRDAPAELQTGLQGIVPK